MKAALLNPASKATTAADALFVPEGLTPLAFTPIYRTFTAAQRLRYNRLHGFYFLEQTVFFEQCMGRPALERLREVAPSQRLREIIGEFIEEEDRHTEWFGDLLRECEPTWYRRERFHVLKAGGIARTLLGFAARHATSFPCLLWLQILAEERAQYFSTVFIKDAGRLDPRFCDVQRRHLADEGDHIRWDAELIEWLWPATPLLLRRINARLLRWVIHEFFHLPKRSGWNVIEHWLVEFPELAARKPELRAAMQGLARNGTYLRTLYPRAVFPRTRRLASRWPELRFLEEFFTE